MSTLLGLSGANAMTDSTTKIFQEPVRKFSICFTKSFIQNYFPSKHEGRTIGHGGKVNCVLNSVDFGNMK